MSTCNAQQATPVVQLVLCEKVLIWLNVSAEMGAMPFMPKSVRLQSRFLGIGKIVEVETSACPL
jgi:hypothetical protein